ncbi:MAG TPA: MoxR family ATPase [Balneolales bacterium]|nr:MoxR family ATPase [Balneolales bacterium]
MNAIPKDPEEAAELFQKSFKQLKKEIAKIVVGQENIVDLLLISLFSRGHCMLVGVPGLAKTLLVRTVSETLNLSFNRIQFTPDLMPSDITGTDIIQEDYKTGHKSFKFIKGPIFANIILADEINRTPPKTQAALLEAMQEYHVTTSGNTYKLALPFFVLATQNPIEQEGTYPLPEAQLDRFMFNLHLDYPRFDEELDIIGRTTSSHHMEVQSILDAEQIIAFQELVREVVVPDNVLKYAVKLVSMTRPNTEHATDFINRYMSWGAGPRASQYLILGAKTRALARGRFNVIEEDIQSLAIPVLRHRIVNNYAAEADGINTVSIINKLVQSI